MPSQLKKTRPTYLLAFRYREEAKDNKEWVIIQRLVEEYKN